MMAVVVECGYGGDLMIGRKVADGLWCGDAAYFEKHREAFCAVIHACKEPYHRMFVGYTGRRAPKGTQYYAAYRGDELALNMVDADDKRFFPDEMMGKGIRMGLIRSLADGVLVHCNEGRSRGPGLAMAIMRARGDFRGKTYEQAKEFFRKVYPEYEPKRGIEDWLIEHWDTITGEID